MDQQINPRHTAQSEAEGDLVLNGPPSDIRVRQRVVDALSQIPGGDKLDEFLGISSGTPQQSPEEARKSAALIDELRQTSQGAGDLSGLLARISQHANTSGADPDALRALMRLGRKGADQS